MLDLTKTSNGRSVLTLPPILDHGVLHELKAVLIGALEQSPQLDIDASAVRKITTQAAQLLVAARLTGNDADGGQCRIVAPSSSFSEFVATLSLGKYLGLTEIPR